MASTNPVQIFGICRVVLYDTETREYFGPPIRVAQGTTFSADKELIENSGGCSAYPYSVATGRSSAEGSVSFNELSPWMLAKLAGGVVVINGAEAGGNVSSLANITGSSMDDAADGITIGAITGSETSLQFGAYRVVAKTATTVDVFCATSSLDDSMIIATDLDVSVTAQILTHGLELDPIISTDLTVGDVAVFDVRPINSGSSVSVMGGTGDITPEVGMLMYAPNQDGNLIEVDVYRSKFAGLPINLTSNEFMSFEASFKSFYSAPRDGVYAVKTINGAS